jgi:hypothetical protein
MIPKRIPGPRKYSIWDVRTASAKLHPTEATRRVSMVRELSLLTVIFVFSFLGAIVVGVF